MLIGNKNSLWGKKELLGSELIVNGDFSNGTTGWLIQDASSVVSSPYITLTYANVTQWFYNNGFAVEIGKTYKLSLEVDFNTDPNISATIYISRSIKAGGGTILNTNSDSPKPYSNTLTYKEWYFTADVSTLYFSILTYMVSGENYQIGNISVKEVIN